MKKLLCTLILIITTVGFVQAQQDINVQGNGIDIVDADTTPDLADHTDFGDVAIGSSFTRVYTIQNTGNATLNIIGSGITFDFPPSTEYVFDFTGLNIAIAPGGFTNFSVIVTPTALGSLNNGITIVTDDPDAEASYTYAITVNGIAAVQDINVQGNSTDIVDGDATPDLADHTDFGDVAVGSSLTRVYTIQNTGGSVLNIIGSGITFDFPPSAEYVFDFAGLNTSIAPGGFTTFSVVFTPTVVGIIDNGITIVTDDPDAEASYTFSITANGTAAVQDINLQGNSTDIVDGDTTPDLTDHTDFGDVAIGSSLTRVYTIQNTGGAVLNIIGSGVTFDFPPSAEYAFDFTGFSTSIAPGGFTTFSVIFTPTVVGSVNSGITIVTDDPDAEASYTFSITANGISSIQDINVQGNSTDIADGDTTPDLADHTDFGDVIVGANLTRVYTIQNTGGAVLNIIGTGITFDFPPSPEFVFDFAGLNTSIAPGGFTTFSVIFAPTVLGAVNGGITIETDDPDTEASYTFSITGNGISDPITSAQLLITQYYEGTGPNDNWIEVKNISATTSLANAYHLALYEDLEGTTSGFISTSPPTISVAIPTLNAGEVVLFRRGGGASINLGPASIEPNTEVCRFNGNDIVLISTTNGVNCYNDRIDIMGVVGGASAITWGADTSLIKGCGTDEVPTIIYDAAGIAYNANQYIELTLAEVANANVLTNIAIGTQTVGAMTWTTSWGGVEIPDKTKDVIIAGTYNNANGSFESCNLTINAGATINLDSGGAGSNYVLVAENLTVNGTFIIGDTEALVTVNPDATMSGSVEKREVTTSLNNFRDFTYWSSPVSTTIASAFSGVDANRIFQWELPTTTPNFWGDWSLASGAMTSARGYISEAPSGTPDGGTHAVSFNGTPNNGTIGIVVGHNNDGFGDSDFNLIGNPYPSAINIDEFIQSVSNNDIDGTIWLWTHNTAIDAGAGQFLGLDYATYNLTGGLSSQSGSPTPTSNIGSSQGFFVKAVSGGPVFFENSMRLSGGNTQFFRAPDEKTTTDTPIKDRVWLHVESSEGGAFSQILIGFFGNATDGFDRGYDGTRLGASWINFYSKIDTLPYAIQGLSSFNIDKKVQIGFETYIPDALSYKISIDNIEGALEDNDLYLVDNELGIVHDLKLADYEFDVNGEGIFSDRFTMQFTNEVLAIDDLELDTDFVVINEDNVLQLRANTVIKQVKVYDMMGRLLIDTKPNNSEFSINTHAIRKGTVLIINATFENGAEVSKKAIKY